MIFITAALISAVVLSIIFANNGENKFHKGSRNFEFSYNVKIPSIPQNSKTVDVFIPLPKDDNAQKISDLNILTNLKY